MRTKFFSGMTVLVTFFATNLFAAEIAIKTTPTLTVKEPITTTTVKEPIVAPSTTIEPIVRVPATTIQVSEPTIAPAIKEPVLVAPTIKTPTIVPAIREPLATPTIKAPILTPAVREPVVKSPDSVQIREPGIGIKDPSLMGVRGEQILDSGRMDAIGGKGLDAIGGKGLDMTGPGGAMREGLGLPGTQGGKGMDFSDPASGLRNFGPGAAGADRGSVGSQFGLGDSHQNPRGTPSLNGGVGDSRLMQGGSWTGRTEWTDTQRSNNGQESTDIQGSESYSMEDGSTLEVETSWNSETGGSQTATLRDKDGNVVATETTEIPPSGSGGSGTSGSDSGGSDSGNNDAGGSDAGGDGTAGTDGGDQDPAATPDPEGGTEPLPPEMQAMVDAMLQRKHSTEVSPQRTLINPGNAGTEATGGGTPKGELSTEGRLDPYINPGQDGGDGPTVQSGTIVVDDVKGSLINPGSDSGVIMGSGNKIEIDPNRNPEKGGGGNEGGNTTGGGGETMGTGVPQ